MTNKFKFFILFALCFQVTTAQKNDPVVMTINGHPITKSEFEYTYRKNNSENAIDRKSLDEYAQMFIDYKLKVEEAKAKGYDTTKTFVTEYNSYRDQLAQPYLENNEVKERISREMYERKKQETEVSHILLRLPQQYLPKDTLPVWNKIMDIRNKIVNEGADFNQMAFEYSEDPSAKQAERGGYMNWATAMMFVDGFEDTMYKTPVNGVSMPVRTPFGYHLIKVHDRRPSLGEVRVSHIMFGIQPQMTPAQQDSMKYLSDEVYQKLIAGADFKEMATQYSTDTYSKGKGGELPWFGTAQYPKTFEDASFALQNKEDISKPVRTPFGYHIIKLEEKRPLASWEDTKGTIDAMFGRGLRAKEIRNGEIERLAKGWNFSQNMPVYNRLISLVDTTFSNNPRIENDYKNPSDVLFTLADSKYTVGDFFKFLATDRMPENPLSTDDLKEKYAKFLLQTLQKQEKNSLAEKFPEFKNLSQEYYDGILLFELMDKEVWGKSQTDTLGLEKYFAQNRTKYGWNEPKYKGAVILTGNEQSRDLVKSMLNLPTDSLYKKLNELQRTDENFKVKINRGAWAKGEDQFVDYIGYNVDVMPATSDDFPYYSVVGKLQAQPELIDVRGEVLNDYQQHLEKELMAKLRKKYPFKINKKELQKVKL